MASAMCSGRRLFLKWRLPCAVSSAGVCNVAFCCCLCSGQSFVFCLSEFCLLLAPAMCSGQSFVFCWRLQWGAADAEIKVPSGENTELKRSPFKAWSRSVYSHTCYTYCQGFLPCLFLPFRSIHLHFGPKPLAILPVLAVANTWFLFRLAE